MCTLPKFPPLGEADRARERTHKSGEVRYRPRGQCPHSTRCGHCGGALSGFESGRIIAKIDRSRPPGWKDSVKLRNLPIFVRWAAFAVTVYVSATVIQAVVWAFPHRQADIQFDLEYLFWIWAIPTALHYLAIGIGRAVNRYEMSRPLPGLSADELAWKAFTHPEQRRSAVVSQDPDVS